MAHSDKCDRDGCDEPTPWDMASIKFDDHTFCSPDCARTVLKTLDPFDHDETAITLHDPQFAVDRDALPPTVDAADVDITHAHTGIERSLDALDDIEMLFPREFRVTDDRRTNIKVYGETKARLDAVKREGETWDECLQRLAQLDRATQMPEADE